MKSTSKARGKALLSVGLLLVSSISTVSALEIPAGLAEALAADDFRAREKAEAELLSWSREQPVEVRQKLLRTYRATEDPEIRHRVLGVLKTLVIDDYLEGGSGFIGITMNPGFMEVPGENNVRKGVLVAEVNPGTPAEIAGLNVGDVIVMLNGTPFDEPTIDAALTQKVKQFKPGVEITLRIIREGAELDVKLRLMRRPDELEALNGLDARGLWRPMADIQAIDQASKDSFFKRWLERQ